MDLPLMHSGQAVASTDSQFSYTAQKESGPLCVNHVQLAVSFADRSYVTSKKGELKMAVHSGFLSYRNVETKRGARPREEAPFIGGHVQETSLGVSKLKKRNRGCVNLYGKKMTTERGGSYIPKTKLK